jgi:hypothetical protein
MPGKSVKIGPFVKGLNNISQSGESKDDEVVQLVNFEVALDDSLTCRPPIEVVNGSTQPSTVTDNWQVFGIYRVSITEWYVIAQYMTSPGNWSVVAIQNGDPTGTVITIKTITSASNKITGFSQWQSTCYFIVAASATINGFSWSKGGTATDVSALPKGDILVAHKNRLWAVDTQTAANANTINFSTINSTGSHPELWSGTDNIIIDAGAGGFITAILPLTNSMLIFKSDSTYRFSYPTAPANGQVDKLSDYIGAGNKYSVVNFENYVYLCHQGRVYELINNIFMQINKLVYFQPDSDPTCVDSQAPSVSMSVVSRRILVQYNNTTFCYSIDTKAWSQWRSYSGTPGKFYMLPQDPASASPNVYICGSQGVTQNPSSNYITDVTSAAALNYIQSSIEPNFAITLDGVGGINVQNNTGTANTRCDLYLNGVGNSTPQGFNVPCSAGLRFSLSGTMTVTSGGTVNARMTFLLRTGGTTTVDVVIPSGAFTVSFTTPAQAIQAYLTVWSSNLPVGGNFNLSNLQHIRTNDSSPMSLLKLTDHHINSPTAVEYIECVVRTKSYDYQAPANIKRLFYWDIDCVTLRDINTITIPIAKKLPVMWGDLQGYTHAQLAQGTWGNPLSWKSQSLNIIDSDSLANTVTENGRVLAKNILSLRFRQISFEIKMTSLGNTLTGPCKVFGLVTYALPHEKESAKVS